MICNLEVDTDPSRLFRGRKHSMLRGSPSRRKGLMEEKWGLTGSGEEESAFHVSQYRGRGRTETKW